MQREKCIEFNLSGSFNVINFALNNNIKIIYSASSSVMVTMVKMKTFLHMHGLKQKTLN